jgi:phenylacetate-CoA ligase
MLRITKKDELISLQRKRLYRQSKYVYANSALYRKLFTDAKITPDDIKTPEDLKKLPLITREFLLEMAEKTGDPYGGCKCDILGPVRMVTSYLSSKSDEKQLLVAMNSQDEYWLSEVILRCLQQVPIMRGERMVVDMWPTGVLPHGLATCWDAELPLTRIGATAVFNLGLEIFIERGYFLCKSYMPSLFMVQNRLLPRYEECFEKYKTSPQQLGIKKLIIVSEINEATPPLVGEQKLRFKEKWGVDVHNFILLSDAMFIATECKDDRFHVWEDIYITEVVDPKTGEPLPIGKRGKLAVTNLVGETMPLVRFCSPKLDVSLVKEDCEFSELGTHLIFQEK